MIVRLSTFVQMEISPLDGLLYTFCTAIPSPLMMNPNSSGDPLTIYLAP